ncbi:MAG: DUF1499 domain-containing protein [Cellvibrionaceae bacterium]
MASDTPWTLWLVYLQVFLVAIMLLALVGHKLAWLPFSVAFYGFGLSVLLIVLVGVVALLALLVSLVTGSTAWRGFAAAALLIGLIPPALIVTLVGPGNFSVPPIHDISTDLENPPEFIAAHAHRKAGENSLTHAGESLARSQQQAYSDIRPILTMLSPELAFARSLETTEELGWVLLTSVQAEGRIEAYDETTFFGFKDDVVIRITPAENGSQIDLRSASRVGRSDLGANAARIRRFRQHFLENEGVK